MKKILLSLTLLLFIAGSFTSCNKKKLNELEDELAATKTALENANNANTNAINNANNGAGTGNPLTVTATGNRGFDSTAFSFTDVFYHKNYAYFNKYSDGTYYIYIYNEKSVHDDNEGYAYIEIDNYDPAVGISGADVYVYNESYVALGDTAATLYFWEDGYNGNNLAINSFSFNTTTKAISFDGTVTDTEADNDNSTNNAATVRYQYSGTLLSDDNVSRIAARRAR